MAVTSLYPLPGSKRSSKYAMLRNNGLGNLCEPFMGGAATSLMTRKSSVLGEINPWHREIAAMHRKPRLVIDYVDRYYDAKRRFVAGVGQEVFLSYKNREKAQTNFSVEQPGLYEELGQRWRVMLGELFSLNAKDSVGLYSFMQRAAFGNVMRLNPAGTAFNVSWHVQKLVNALSFDPMAWADDLAGWNPKVLPSWEAAIAAAKPKSTHLLLDPPYWVDGQTEKMTPCYPGHSIGTMGGHDETYRLAVNPLETGLKRRFPLIHLCNYHSARLEADVCRLAFAHGYSVARFEMGLCCALGRGRLVHGQRVDGRSRPIEVIWQLEPARQLALF